MEVYVRFLQGHGLFPGFEGLIEVAQVELDFGEGMPCGNKLLIRLQHAMELRDGLIGLAHGEIKCGLIDQGLQFLSIHRSGRLREREFNRKKYCGMREAYFRCADMVRYPKRPSPVKQSNAFVEIRKSPIHGMGVFASRRIRKGTRIIQYIGERIDKEESNRRGLALFEEAQKTGGASVYIFDLNDEWDLDGNKPYNDARLINHSCEPNAEMVNEDDELWLYALRDILPGEEISFDYGYDLEHFLDHPCRCGKDACVGYIVSRAQWPELKRRLRGRKRKPATS